MPLTVGQKMRRHAARRYGSPYSAAEWRATSVSGRGRNISYHRPRHRYFFDSDGQPFRFLDLPTELRVRVYELLLVGHGAVHTWAQEWYGDGLWSKHANKHGIDWSITMVNRQIKSETLPILYAKNTFKLWLARQGDPSYEPEEAAVARAKERCSLVRTLTVDAGAFFNLHSLSSIEFSFGLNTMQHFIGLRKLTLDGNDDCCYVCYDSTQKVLRVLSSLVKKLPSLEEVVIQGMYENEVLINQVYAHLEEAKIYRMLEAPIHIV